MIRTLLITACLFIASGISAQKEKPKNDATYDDRALHFGFTIGFNAMDYDVRVYNDTMVAEVDLMQPGFHVQMVSNLRLNDHFCVRVVPGLLFGQRDLTFRNRVDTSQNITMSFHPSYIQFPILLKYRAKRVNNFCPYLIGGINGMYDLSSKRAFIDNKKQYIILKPIDLAYEVGFGIDFYLPFFKFSTELKLVKGFFNVKRDDVHKDFPMYSRAIRKIYTSAILLSLHFE